jgi:hypothetical protein
VAGQQPPKLAKELEKTSLASADFPSRAVAAAVKSAGVSGVRMAPAVTRGLTIPLSNGVAVLGKSESGRECGHALLVGGMAAVGKDRAALAARQRGSRPLIARRHA